MLKIVCVAVLFACFCAAEVAIELTENSKGPISTQQKAVECITEACGLYPKNDKTTANAVKKLMDQKLLFTNWNIVLNYDDVVTKASVFVEALVNCTEDLQTKYGIFQ